MIYNCFKPDKSVDDVDDGEVSSVTARGIVDMLERDNKSLVQRSRELEKQLHILRAAGSRMPPSKSVHPVLCLSCITHIRATVFMALFPGLTG